MNRHASPRRWCSPAVALLVVGFGTAGCGRTRSPDPASDASTAAREPADTGAAGDSANAATPVRMATVRRGNVALMVSGPGRTEALDVQKVRAPFTGTLDSLDVVLGDRVTSGQIIGSVVSQPSEAALIGAEAMVRSAATPSQRSDAERALALARQNLVHASLRAPRAGVVVSRGASPGDLMTQGDSIVSIASAGSIVFTARIAQSDLARIRPGQRATIDAPGHAMTATGVVHGILPSDTGAMSVPVRIDLRASATPMPIGLFGTAHITVEEHAGVALIPAAALLRDDVNGVSRIAVVSPDNHVHWVAVSVGVQQGDAVEIAGPPLTPGARVILSGQVGLPEGSRVREVNDSLPSPKPRVAP